MLPSPLLLRVWLCHKLDYFSLDPCHLLVDGSFYVSMMFSLVSIIPVSSRLDPPSLTVRLESCHYRYCILEKLVMYQTFFGEKSEQRAESKSLSPFKESRRCQKRCLDGSGPDLCVTSSAEHNTVFTLQTQLFWLRAYGSFW